MMRNNKAAEHYYFSLLDDRSVETIVGCYGNKICSYHLKYDLTLAGTGPKVNNAI